MTILLVNPYISDFTAFDLWLRPLGLYAIARSLRQYSRTKIHWIDCLDRFQEGTGISVKGDGRGKYPRVPLVRPDVYHSIPRQYSLYGIPWPVFQKRLDEVPEPGLILVTTLMTYWLDGTRLVVKELRQKFPKAAIVCGGLIPTLLESQAEHLIPADEFVFGPGETAILEIVRRYGGEVCDEPPASGSVPLFCRRMHTRRQPAPLLTSRGCPYRCIYCAAAVLNPEFQERGAADVIAEIETLTREGIDQFVFFDDALLIHKETRFIPIFSHFRGKNLIFHAPNGLHAAAIDRETAELMHAGGLQTVRISLESVLPRIQRDSDGKVTTDQVSRAIAALVKAGYPRLQIEVYLLAGYPGQTIGEIEESLRYIREEGVRPRLSIFSPVPGTPIYSQLQKKGVLSDPVDPYQANKTYFLYAKSGFTPDAITVLKNSVTEAFTGSPRKYH